MAKYKKTPILYYQKFENINEEKGIISGVHVCCEGEAKGHDTHLNKEFINDVIKFGNLQSAGVKSRFGHPTMSNTALGTYIGRFSNFRSGLILRNDGMISHSAIADLYLDEVSKKSPNGDLYSYIIDLAKSNPDMFGSSIQFKRGKGKEVKEKTDKKDSEGNDIYNTKYYEKITALLATDLVDSAAATDKLFSSDILSVNVTKYLDDNPEIYDLLIEKPEIVDNFLKNYNSYKEKQAQLNQYLPKLNGMNENETGLVLKDEKGFFDKIGNYFKPEIKDISDETKEEYESKLLKASETETELKAKIAEFEKNDNAEEITAKNTEIEELKSEVSELNTKLAAYANEGIEPKAKDDKLNTGEMTAEEKMFLNEVQNMAKY